MSIEEIRNKISIINSETARLNTQRNQNIGRQETLKKQLDEAFNKYKQNYGVELTSENLQAELDFVTRRKEEELGKIEQILNFINSGDIVSANKLAGVGGTDSASQDVAQNTPDNASVSKDVLSEIPTSVVSTPEVFAPTAPPIEQVITPPSSVVPPIPTSSITPPTPPKAPVLTGAESLEMGMPALEGFSKSTLGSIAPPSKPKDDAPTPPTPPKTQVQDFSAILNGTAFQPK